MIRPRNPNPNPEFEFGAADTPATPMTSADRRPRHVVAH